MLQLSIKSRREAKKDSLPTGFEPVRENPNRFQVCRLNHSAIVAGSFEKPSFERRKLIIVFIIQITFILYFWF
jgi:hypothetical protein